MRFSVKTRGYFCNLSVGVALKGWFSHVQYMKMTRDEHVLGFKSCEISIYWWIWMLSFLLKEIWIGIDYFLLKFFGTFDSVLGLQITVNFGSVCDCRLLKISVQFCDCRLLKDCRLTVDCSHSHVGSHLLQAQCCVALSQTKKDSNRQSSASY